MIATFLLFLPCFVALALAFICTWARRQYYDGKFITLCICVAVYFFVDAAYVTPGVEILTAVSLDPIGISSEFCIIPALVVYLFSQWKKRSPKLVVYMSYLPAVVIGTTILSFMLVAGRHNIADAIQLADTNGYNMSPDTDPNVMRYLFVSVNVSRSGLSLELLLGVIFMIYMAVMNWRSEERSKRFLKMTIFGILSIAISAARIALTRQWLIEHPAASCAMSICLALIFAGFCMSHMTSEKKPQIQTADEDKPEESKAGEEAPDGEDNQSDEREYAIDSNLKKRLLALLDEEKEYLSPDLTIESVAEKLGTNRTYISMIINKEFGKSFREFINERRVSHAKEFMLANPQSKIEEIAEASGFASGAQFCRKFKEIEGLTPNTWLRSRPS